MAIINIDKDSIPLKAYLRADPNSQHFKYTDNTGEFVTDDMFWGTLSNEGLYLDFSRISGRNIQISSGISETNGIQTLHDQECDNWIDNNLINAQNSKMFVIQGYAGCGKTTFINHLMKKSETQKKKSYIDIGQDWTYPQEPYMFFNEALNKFGDLLDEVMSKTWRERNAIWKNFFELGLNSAIKQFDLELPNAISSIKKIKSHSYSSRLRINIHEFLNERYGSPLVASEQPTHSVWHNCGQTQTIVALIILLKCAEYTTRKQLLSNNISCTLIFDNLDVITDPAIPAENVLLLWGVISRYVEFKTQYDRKARNKLPALSIIISVRKVLYSHITSHLPDLEMMHPYDANAVYVCDISNLYFSQNIMAHRISYWEQRLHDKQTLEKLHQLQELITIHSNSNSSEDESTEVVNDEYLPKDTINLDAFVNHNYRAYTNALCSLFEDLRYTKIIMHDYDTHTMAWQKVSSLVFLLSILYRKESVWNSMGFECKDFDNLDYPATLNRLILNYLFTAKRGKVLYQFASGRSDIPTNNNVSLNKIIDSFEKILFLSIKTTLNDEEIQDLLKNAGNKTKDLILDRLADMCARKSIASPTGAHGYDTDDDELWRRPLYFTGGVKLNHTASSHYELKDYFEKCINSGQEEKIRFSITDEGYVLINDIVISFEFYSARFCDANRAIPLHQASTEDQLDAIIQPVYNAVKKCCRRTITFMDQYTKQYNMTTDEFLCQSFNSRTNPRFDHGKKTAKKLSISSFRPQLHVVRTIYSHIGYFNSIMENILSSDLPEREEMSEALAHWINEYLKLYEEFFRIRLDGTVCNSDNNVFNNLKRKHGQQPAKEIPEKVDKQIAKCGA